MDILEDEVPANKLDLIYKLEGEFTEGVNVFELSPILLNLGQLIQESNKIINPGGREIAVNVKPFGQGSFLVDITVFAKNNLQQALDMVNQDGAKNVKELLEWIGLVGGSGMSVIGLIKYLKGKPKKIEKVSPGQVEYTPKEGASIRVDTKVHALFNYSPIQQHIYQIAGRPFEIKGVEGISTHLKDEPEQTKVEIPMTESEYFKEFEDPEIFDDSERTMESRVTLLLNPKRGSYEGGKGPYSFTTSGSQEQRYVMHIKDEEFLGKLASGEIRLHHTDLVEAKILIEQKVKDNVVQSTVYYIEEVVDYTKAKQQQNLSLFDGEAQEPEEE